jgi:hypothetical protein
MVLFVACAAGSTGSDTEDLEQDVIPVLVRNNLTPPTAITIRVLKPSGTRVVLGTVPPRTARTLRFKESFFESGYLLVAQTTEGTEVASRPFDLFPRSAVEWTLTTNSLAVRTK